MRTQFASNVLGISKFNGILYTKDFSYVAYNIDAANSRFYPENDENIFRREIIRKNKDVHILFFGKGDFKSLVSKVTAKETKHKYTGANFSKAYNEFSFPISLVPLTEIGVNQLRIILTPNYRETFSRFMLGLNYQSVGTNWIDALKGDTKECFIVLFDFDLKRLDRALRFTQKPLHILVLEEQCGALMDYLGERKAEIYEISANEAMRILGLPQLSDWSSEPYITSKGVGLNVEVTEKKKRARTNKDKG